MRRFVELVVVLCVLMWGQLAQAQVTTFSDRTAWNSAVGGLIQTEDLNGFIADTSFQNAGVALLNMTIEEINGPPSNFPANLIDAPPLEENGKRSNGTSYVLGEIDSSPGTTIRIDFLNPVSGWGADFISHDADAVIDIFDQSDNLIGTTTSVSADTTFYGFHLDAGESAGRIELRFGGVFNDLFGMDDLSFVQSASAPPCTLDLTLTLNANTLEMDFDLGTTDPAIWNVWLSIHNFTFPLWNSHVPSIDPPVSIPVPIPVPEIGSVGVLTTLVQPTGFPVGPPGIICSDWQTVDTGTPAVMPSARELKQLFGKYAR